MSIRSVQMYRGKRLWRVEGKIEAGKRDRRQVAKVTSICTVAVMYANAHRRCAYTMHSSGMNDKGSYEIDDIDDWTFCKV